VNPLLTGYAPCRAEEEGHEIDEDERALMARALMKNSVIIAK